MPSLFSPRFAAVFTACCVVQFVAQAAAPTVTHLFPAGGKKGETVEVQAFGDFKPWPVQAWVDRPGLKVECGEKSGTLKVTAAENALPGVYWIRLHNAEGASAARPFVVGGLPEIVEREPNAKIGEATPAPREKGKTLAVTVNGRLAEKSDVDMFAVELEQGETLVAAMTAHRVLGSPMDATLQVVAPDGFTAAQNDDDSGLDPLLVFTAPAAGRYFVRTFAFPAAPNSSVAFSSDPKYVYRLTLTTGPFSDFLFPLAIASGVGAKWESVGWNQDKPPAVEVPPSASAVDPLGPLFGDRNTAEPGVVGRDGFQRLIILPFPTTTDESLQASETPADPVAGLAVSGRLSAPGEEDALRIVFKKGARRQLRVEARRLGSMVDARLAVHAEDGRQLALNDDDKRLPDPSLLFNPPADGVYTVRISDLHNRGGARFPYLLLVEPTGPDFSLRTTADVHVAKVGQPLEITIAVDRRNGMNADLEITAVDLPDFIQVEPAKSISKDPSGKQVKFKLTCTQPYSGPLSLVGRTLSDPSVVRPVAAPLVEYDTVTRALWLSAPKP